MGGHDSGDDLDQSGFAGAVVADEPQCLAGTELEVDRVERADRAEVAGDTVEAEDGGDTDDVFHGCAHRLSSHQPRSRRP